MNDDLKKRVLAAARASPSPSRAASRMGLWLVLPASAIVAAALFFAFDGAAHGAGRVGWFYAASSVGWTAVAGLALWGALARGASAVGRPRAWLMVVTLGTPALLFAMMFGFAVVHPEATLVHPEKLGLKCLGLTLAAAAFPLAGLSLVRRGSDPVHPASTGAALGAACGASAGVMVEMWCPVATPAHIALGHILPILLLAGIGASLGARVVGLRGPRSNAPE